MEINLVPKELEINVEMEEIPLQGGYLLTYNYYDFTDYLYDTIQDGDTARFRSAVRKIFHNPEQGEDFFTSYENFDRNAQTVGVDDPRKQYSLYLSNNYFVSQQGSRFQYNSFLYGKLVYFLKQYIAHKGTTEANSEERKLRLRLLPDGVIRSYQSEVIILLNELKQKNAVNTGGGGGSGAAEQVAQTLSPTQLDAAWEGFTNPVQTANAGRRPQLTISEGVGATSQVREILSGNAGETQYGEEYDPALIREAKQALNQRFTELYDTLRTHDYDQILRKLRKIDVLLNALPESPELDEFLEQDPYINTISIFYDLDLFSYISFKRKESQFFDLLEKIYGEGQKNVIYEKYQEYKRQEFFSEETTAVRPERPEEAEILEEPEEPSSILQRLRDAYSGTASGLRRLAKRASTIGTGLGEGVSLLQNLAKQGISGAAQSALDALQSARKPVEKASSFAMAQLRDALTLATYDQDDSQSSLGSESRQSSRRSSRRSSLGEAIAEREAIAEPRRGGRGHIGLPKLEGAHFFKMYKSTLKPDIPASQRKFRLENQIGFKFFVTRYEPRYTDRTERYEDEIDDIGNEFLNLLTEDEYIIFQGIREYYGMGKEDKTQGRSPADVDNFNKILLKQNSAAWNSLMEKIGERTIQLGFTYSGPFQVRTNVQKYFILGNLLYGQGTKAKSWEMKNLMSELNRSNL